MKLRMEDETDERDQEDQRDQQEEMQKPSLFHKILKFAGKFQRKTENASAQYVQHSKFREYLQDLSPTDELYKIASQASDLCDEALKIAKMRLVCINRILKMDIKIQELDCFFKLSDEEATQLKNMLDRFMSLTKERNNLRNQLTSFDRSLTYMMDLESDATYAIPQIQDAEKNQRILKHDLAQLEGERADLEHERHTLEMGLDFVNKFSVSAVVLFVIAALVLGYRFMFGRVSIFFSTTVLILLVIVAVAVLHLFKKRMKYELQINLKKQRRAVELLNKKNVVYVYYTNFLNFEYRKYKVRSSQMLKTSLSDYGNYKHITTRIDNIRNIMYENERQIEVFLRAKKMNNAKFTIEHFAHTVNLDDKLEYCKELMAQKSGLEKKLTDLDVQHEKVWDSIEDLSENDDSENQIVGKIIQAYIDEVGTLIQSIDKEDKAV